MMMRQTSIFLLKNRLFLKCSSHNPYTTIAFTHTVITIHFVVVFVRSFDSFTLLILDSNDEYLSENLKTLHMHTSRTQPKKGQTEFDCLSIVEHKMTFIVI